MQQSGLERASILDLPGHALEKAVAAHGGDADEQGAGAIDGAADHRVAGLALDRHWLAGDKRLIHGGAALHDLAVDGQALARPDAHQISLRSEEHTSELQSLMRISYAVFCLKKKQTQKKIT